MSRNASFYLRAGLLIIFILFIFGYSFFQARNIIFGPEIYLKSPLDGETYENPLVEIKGVAQNADFLYLDDRPIFTDTNGNFDEKLLLSPGYNAIKLDAEDKFGKKTEKIVQVIFKANPDTLPKSQVANPIATSTISTTTNR